MKLRLIPHQRPEHSNTKLNQIHEAEAYSCHLGIFGFSALWGDSVIL